ncbi:MULTISPECIES: RluA family pseudouridine synthase [unclassified Sporosarcina]|uniref:RluA family pseudouridine synthase n=1 Tax=unclassified Sporosarcina TaxID=2647733 RepID=UPI00203BEC9C|nr:MULTISPECIES: RluA family pseudouridine synthase [unclassified Sporosarcina]GKV67004.1 pseudouridine synthase [Sporosarcina sp. NCCP-2331]GLB57334.1 pseudouridine synthase [Sporosarcina sp. NCCP-2378]
MTSFHYTTIQPGETVEQLLREQWQGGKKTVHQMRMDKSVTDSEGLPVEWKEPLPEGTELTFSFSDAQSSYKPEPFDLLNIVWEDEHLLAVNKRAGVSVHPEHAPGTGTLMNEVMGYISSTGGTYAEHVHRLDQHTAGILLIAKHPIAKTMLDRMLEQNKIDRFYTAEVEGQLRKPRGTINMPIGKDRYHATRRRVSPSGQSAVTHFKVLERLANSTLVEAQLETGRTHQIRVHFSHMGHPVVGDQLYGSETIARGPYKLIASKVAFDHPITSEAVLLETE